MRACAVVLFAYVGCVFATLAGGLLLGDGMLAVARVSLGFSMTRAGTLVLAGVLIALMASQMRAVLTRRVLLGSPVRGAVPFALIAHLAARHGHETKAAGRDQPASLIGLVLAFPAAGAFQIALLCLVWIDASVTLRGALRFWPWWRGLAPAAMVAAVLVPALAALGFANAMFERAAPVGGVATSAPLAATLVAGLCWGAVLIASGLCAHFKRWRNRHLFVGRVAMEGVGSMPIPKGATLLDVLSAHSVAPPTLCGGRGECSTCLVRILERADRHRARPHRRTVRRPQELDRRARRPPSWFWSRRAPVPDLIPARVAYQLTRPAAAIGP